MARLLAILAACAATAALSACGDDAGTPASGPASFVPADSAMYFEASLASEEQIAAAEALIAELGEVPLLGSTLDPRDLIEQAIAESAAETGADVSYAEDIEPWLGDTIGIGITSNENLDSGAPPPFVIAAESDDDEIAMDSIERTIASDPDAGEIEDIEIAGEGFRLQSNEGVAFGIVDGTLLVGTQDSLEAALAARDGDSLATDDGYEDATSSLADERLALGYIDLGPFVELAALEDGDSVEQVDAVDEVLGGALGEPLALALRAEDGAVAVEASVPAELLPALAGADALGKAPAEAFGALALADVPAQVRERLEQVGAAGQALGEDVTEEQVIAGFELILGADFEDLEAAGQDGVLAVSGDLPSDVAVTARVQAEGDGTVLQTAFEGLALMLENEEGLATADASTPDSAGIVVGPGGSEPTAPEGELAGEEAFTAAADLLGDEWAYAGFADPGPILDAVLNSGSLTDVVTGDASPEEAIAGFAAGRIGYAALGSRDDGERTTLRFVVGLD